MVGYSPWSCKVGHDLVTKQHDHSWFDNIRSMFLRFPPPQGWTRAGNCLSVPNFHRTVLGERAAPREYTFSLSLSDSGFSLTCSVKYSNEFIFFKNQLSNPSTWGD